MSASIGENLTYLFLSYHGFNWKIYKWFHWAHHQATPSPYPSYPRRHKFTCTAVPFFYRIPAKQPKMSPIRQIHWRQKHCSWREIWKKNPLNSEHLPRSNGPKSPALEHFHISTVRKLNKRSNFSSTPFKAPLSLFAKKPKARNRETEISNRRMQALCFGRSSQAVKSHQSTVSI